MDTVEQQAQQGHPQAIAILINRHFRWRGLTAQVTRRRDRLLIELHSFTRQSCLLAPAQIVHRLRRGLVRLAPAGIQWVDVVGIWPWGGVWQQSIFLPAAGGFRDRWLGRSLGWSSLCLALIAALVSGGDRQPLGAKIRATGAIAGAETVLGESAAQGAATPVRLEPPPEPWLYWPPPAASTVTIKAVGDIIPGVDYPSPRLPADPASLLRAVEPLLAGADLVFGNFESTFTTHPYTPKDIRRPLVHAFRTPPHYAPLLREAGFDVLSVANNHSFDFGLVGFRDTIRHVTAAGMVPVGEAGVIQTVAIADLTLAWLGFSHTPGHNLLHDLDQAAALVREAKTLADLVIVSVHGGAEGTGALHTRDQTEWFFGENRGNLVRFARTVVDHGADLVLGHGPHVPRALELYQDRLIAYSLGNFLGYRSLATAGPLGTSLVLEVTLAGDGRFLAGHLHPVQLDGRGIPAPDPTQQSLHLIQRLTQQDFPQTPLMITEGGQLQPAIAPIQAANPGHDSLE